MSITLTNKEIFSVGGVATETNDTSANMRIGISFDNPNQCVLDFKAGTIISGFLVPGQHGSYITLTVDLLTGNWISNTGQKGTIPAGSLANFVAQFKTLRNAAESYMVGQNLIPGTQVPW
jgi:hypothetical protein